MDSEWGYLMTQKASVDLDDIVGYIVVKLANPKAASDFTEKLQGVIDEARIFPESGSPVSNEYLAVTNVRKKLVGNFIMYYQPDFNEKKILVLRIVYGRRNMDEVLREINFS